MKITPVTAGLAGCRAEQQSLLSSRRAIALYLPHDVSLVMLDEVVEHQVDEGGKKSATGKVQVPFSWCSGHFDDQRFPGCQILSLGRLIEMGAQLATVAAIYPEALVDQVGFFSREGQWRGPTRAVFPGDSVTLCADISRWRQSGNGMGVGRAAVDFFDQIGCFFSYEFQFGLCSVAAFLSRARD